MHRERDSPSQHGEPSAGLKEEVQDASREYLPLEISSSSSYYPIE
jgi:hypothetical protein